MISRWRWRDWSAEACAKFHRINLLTAGNMRSARASLLKLVAAREEPLRFLQSASGSLTAEELGYEKSHAWRRWNFRCIDIDCVWWERVGGFQQRKRQFALRLHHAFECAPGQ